MRAYLHFYNENSNEPVFYQLLDYDIKVDKGFVFEYTDREYNELEVKTQKEFISYRLRLGKYIVSSTKVEKNEILGDLRHLFLKPTT